MGDNNDKNRDTTTLEDFPPIGHSPPRLGADPLGGYRTLLAQWVEIERASRVDRNSDTSPRLNDDLQGDVGTYVDACA